MRVLVEHVLDLRVELLLGVQIVSRLVVEHDEILLVYHRVTLIVFVVMMKTVICVFVFSVKILRVVS